MKQNSQSLSESAQRIRRRILSVAHHAPSDGVHVSPALSMVDVLSVLFGRVMRYNPQAITDRQRDVFILSKGHAALGLYATLCEYGIISEEQLNRFEINGDVLQVHPTKHPEYGIDFSGGSLAQGLSFASGLAMGRRLRGESWHTYALVGDGECNEGAIWESAFLAAHQQLDNLTLIVDRNGLQSDGFTQDVLRMDLEALWRACHWETLVCDGHDIDALLSAFDAPHHGKPKVIIANTIKGKGVSFMENNKEFHRNRVSAQQLEDALNELNGGVQ
ncbi:MULTISPECIES: transketolase [Enterobacteriaceae]|uniref:Transketolase n=2 Tax=Enterobacteriaceae TaxID=543 RepID=A0ABW1PZL0_9ENTR|nr:MULTISPECIES: transketolase [Phytobacter]MBS6740614.1 transketolase [Enterobacteriaceae bacterium]PXW62191.1 transketolase subunit A [Grimontella sp. AG753]MBV8874479.1 transketolase [Phytobacter sp.]MDU4153692.1 transketolase [Enterobacteriaceae bacterium]MDU7199171.1 transketolase [Enterobacteriaceae bacterium]